MQRLANHIFYLRLLSLVLLNPKELMPQWDIYGGYRTKQLHTLPLPYLDMDKV